MKISLELRDVLGSRPTLKIENGEADKFKFASVKACAAALKQLHPWLKVLTIRIDLR